MKIGFIGTGTIAASMISGLMKSNFPCVEIIISPRNKEQAELLANKYDKVKIAIDNQDVANRSDVVFLCLRSQIAEDALKAITFKQDQQVISVLAMADTKTVESWINHPVFRAVPLPFVEKCQGLTPIYPDSPFLQDMFTALGGVIVAKEEAQFNSFMTAGSFMGVYFRFMAVTQEWLEKKGMDSKTASAYLGNLYGNLADEMRKSSIPNFEKLEREHSTVGGTNEIIARAFGEKGGDKILLEAIEEGYKKITS